MMVVIGAWLQLQRAEIQSVSHLVSHFQLRFYKETGLIRIWKIHMR